MVFFFTLCWALCRCSLPPCCLTLPPNLLSRSAKPFFRVRCKKVPLPVTEASPLFVASSIASTDPCFFFASVHRPVPFFPFPLATLSDPFAVHFPESCHPFFSPFCRPAPGYACTAPTKPFFNPFLARISQHNTHPPLCFSAQPTDRTPLPPSPASFFNHSGSRLSDKVFWGLFSRRHHPSPDRATRCPAESSFPSSVVVEVGPIILLIFFGPPY